MHKNYRRTKKKIEKRLSQEKVWEASCKELIFKFIYLWYQVPAA
ncbi:hypothetical protein HMPREF9071_2254 [Capnocytophaga sp. oral taxon 338 str. F0234]|nr:hypothetical protein HMPREF9071_2254 [Capnocytophaga sp. oral taxon 338 str. F0234]